MKVKTSLPIKKYFKKKRKTKPKKNFKNISHRFPLVTIITVVFNNLAFIEETIQSVLNQTYQNIEYIIIDGGSTDGTLNIIKKYENFVDIFVSEKDKGIYDAMNKGIKLAKGKWINFMNSGDTFYSKDTLSSIPFTNFQNSSMIYGKIKLFSKSRKYIKILNPFICNKFNLLLLGSGVVCHQAVFYNTDIKFRFPDKYKILGDLYSYFEYIKHGPANRLDIIICNYYLGGYSETNNKSRSELRIVLEEQVGVWSFLNFPITLYNSIKMYFIKLLNK
jgi:glycosyltransferase involved in cell wall biosynthesis